MRIKLNEVMPDKHLVLIFGTNQVITVFIVKSKPCSLGLSGVQESKLIKLGGVKLASGMISFTHLIKPLKS